MIGDYQVRMLGAEGGVVRYDAVHVVLPRCAIIELLEPTAPHEAAIALMRRACILEALRHPGVPRIFECGRLGSQPWIAFERIDGIALDVMVRERRLDVGELLDLVEHVATILSHAHERGVLHGDIAMRTIVLGSTVVVTGWENARAHDAVALTSRHRYAGDVLALGKLALDALAAPTTVPIELAALLPKMLADDPSARPTAAEVAATVHAIPRPPMKTGLPAAVAAAIEELSHEDDEVVIEYVLDDERLAV